MFLLYLLTLSFAIVCFVFAFKFYLAVTTWNNSYKCLNGKTAIVTGSNAGIGFYTALDFAKRGARVILACRNASKAGAARDRIVEMTGNPQVVVKIVDFSSLASVRCFCTDFNETEDRLDILVNNAGAAALGNHFTNDNLQILWHINHLSSFLVTHLLIDKLRQSAPSRIVNVSSILAKYGKIDCTKLNTYPDPKKIWESDYFLYCNTKMANVLFTRELHRRVFSSGISVNTLHPGSVATQIFRRLPAKQIIIPILHFLCKTPEKGAQTNIYCAISGEVDGISGELFDSCRRVKTYKNCLDSKLGEELWRVSEELVRMQPHEKISLV